MSKFTNNHIQYYWKYLDGIAFLLAVGTAIIVLGFIIFDFSYVLEHIPETIAGVGLVIVNAAFVYLVWRQVSMSNEIMGENKKAVLVPYVVRLQRTGSDYERRLQIEPVLRVQNHGKAIARDVKVTYDKKELPDLAGKIMGPDVIPYIAPGAYFDMSYYLTMTTDRTYFTIDITWTDDSGKDNKIISTVSLA